MLLRCHTKGLGDLRSTGLLLGDRVDHATPARTEHLRATNGIARAAYVASGHQRIPNFRDAQVPYSWCKVGGVRGAASGMAPQRREQCFE